MLPKDTDEMANSEDLDQSDLGLHCLFRPICLKGLGTLSGEATA